MLPKGKVFQNQVLTTKSIAFRLVSLGIVKDTLISPSVLTLSPLVSTTLLFLESANSTLNPTVVLSEWVSSLSFALTRSPAE